jgi:predicted component of type VI protein secretion system
MLYTRIIITKVEENMAPNYTVELTEIAMKINEMLPQLSDFIGQFNNVVSTTNINVITDSSGNMSIDVPVTMSDIEAEKISKRINIIDRLITLRGQEINDLLQKGLNLETKLKSQNPNYTSQILAKVDEFNRLNFSYKH